MSGPAIESPLPGGTAEGSARPARTPIRPHPSQPYKGRDPDLVRRTG